ncbi:MAG: hypothetical protein DMF56_21645 [Acidobacteria bacterium]|nr:MAG: hypothetical protein DMF56_21645 [Acidobacteriota bacterium]
MRVAVDQRRGVTPQTKAAMRREHFEAIAVIDQCGDILAHDREAALREARGERRFSRTARAGKGDCDTVDVRAARVQHFVAAQAEDEGHDGVDEIDRGELGRSARADRCSVAVDDELRAVGKIETIAVSFAKNGEQRTVNESLLQCVRLASDVECDMEIDVAGFGARHPCDRHIRCDHEVMETMEGGHVRRLLAPPSRVALRLAFWVSWRMSP